MEERKETKFNLFFNPKSRAAAAASSQQCSTVVLFIPSVVYF